MVFAVQPDVAVLRCIIHKRNNRIMTSDHTLAPPPLINHGLLSSVLPAGGLPGITNALNSLSMTLSAVNNIVNSGTIASSRDLSLVAGSSITNTTSAVIQSVNNLTLINSRIANAGLLQSLNGNINIASLLANRNMMCCTVSGQGAGVAAAVSLKKDVSTSEVRMEDVQRELKRQAVRYL